jgi:phenylpyruvate tautomerase PptA (4-oxalocrotonate tautomerase family)
MDMIDRSPRDEENRPRSRKAGERLSRRAVLGRATAAAAAGPVAAIAAAAADTAAAGGFGAPLAKLHFPAGLLSLEQKAAMIRGVSDVLLKATKLPPDQAGKLWVQIFETVEGGWGFGGQVFTPRAK